MVLPWINNFPHVIGPVVGLHLNFTLVSSVAKEDESSEDSGDELTTYKETPEARDTIHEPMEAKYWTKIVVSIVITIAILILLFVLVYIFTINECSW